MINHSIIPELDKYIKEPAKVFVQPNNINFVCSFSLKSIKSYKNRYSITNIDITFLYGSKFVNINNIKRN